MDDYFEDYEPEFNDFSKDDNLVKHLEAVKKILWEKRLRENYRNIVTYGVDLEEFSKMDHEDITFWKENIEIMREFFESTEEYEKCTVLRDLETCIKEF